MKKRLFVLGTIFLLFINFCNALSYGSSKDGSRLSAASSTIDVAMPDCGCGEFGPADVVQSNPGVVNSFIYGTIGARFNLPYFAKCQSNKLFAFESALLVQAMKFSYGENGFVDDGDWRRFDLLGMTDSSGHYVKYAENGFVDSACFSCANSQRNETIAFEYDEHNRLVNIKRERPRNCNAPGEAELNETKTMLYENEDFPKLPSKIFEYSGENENASATITYDYFADEEGKIDLINIVKTSQEGETQIFKEFLYDDSGEIIEENARYYLPGGEERTENYYYAYASGGRLLTKYQNGETLAALYYNEAKGLDSLSVKNPAKPEKNISYVIDRANPYLPETPKLKSPQNSSIGVAKELTLKWKEAERATHYRLQIADANDFSATVLDSLLFELDSCDARAFIEYGEMYYWRVAGRNLYGESDWSDPWYFMVKDAPPIAPEPISPAYNAKDQYLEPEFVWRAVDGAMHYKMNISTSAGFEEVYEVYENLAILDTAFIIPFGTLEPNSKYFWRVAAVANSGVSPWSKILRFETGEISDVETGALSPSNLNLIVYPNPTRDKFYASFCMDKAGEVEVVVMDALGRVVDRRIQERKERGTHMLEFSCERLATGAYFIRIKANNNIETMPINIAK